MTKTSGFISTLGCSKYSTKTLIMPGWLEWSNLDNSSARVFSSQGICLTMTLMKSFYICPTILWYLANKESFTPYSPMTCWAMSCESVKSVTLSAQIFLTNLRPDKRASYSATLLVIRNLNLMEYLNSFFPNPIRKIPTPPPSCANDPFT